MPDFIWIILGCLGGILALFWLVMIAAWLYIAFSARDDSRRASGRKK